MHRVLLLLVIAFAVVSTACDVPQQQAGGASAPNQWNAYPVFDRSAGPCAAALNLVQVSHVTRARGEKPLQAYAELRAKGVALPPRLEESKNVDLFAGVRKRTPRFTVRVDGGTAMIVGADGREAHEIRARVNGILAWRDSALQASQTCHAMALHSAFVVELNEMYGQRQADLAVEREAARRAIAGIKRVDGWAAAALALVALYEAAATGSDPAVIDKMAAVAVTEIMVPPPQVTDQEVDALFLAGRQKAFEIDKWSHRWGPREGVNNDDQRRSLLGVSARARHTPRIDFDTKDLGLTGDSNQITSAVFGFLRADMGAILRGAAILFPADSPVRIGLTGAGAVTQGDFVTALTAASALAPKGSAIETALMVASRAITPPV